jgi:zinc protease
MRKFLAILLSCVSSVAFADGVTQEYHLNNGLTVVVREDHRAPVVVMSVWYKVGGSYEHNGITGISHVLEHLMFRGTKKYGPGVLDKIISENGGEQNATTTADYTVYYAKLSADKLPIAFELEADRMHNLVITQDIFAKEIKVVQEERRMRVEDNSQGAAWIRFQAAAHINNPYHNPTVGWMTDLENMTLADAQKWYHDWYAPNNAVIIVVGDVNSSDVLSLAKKYFTDIKPAATPKLKPRTEVNAEGTRRVDLYLPAKLPFLLMGFDTPVINGANPAWEPYALDVLAYILGGSDSSRFQQHLIRGNQTAVYAQSEYDPFDRYNDLLNVTAIPAGNTSIPMLQNAINHDIRDLQNKLVTPAELDRVKAQLSQAFRLGKPMMSGLSWKDEDNYLDKINAVTPEQIRDVARKYLVPEKLTIGVLHPKNS